MKSFLRSLAAGVLWLAVLWTVDTIDSLNLLRASTRKVKGDEKTTSLIVHSVVNFVGQVALGYLALGLLAGVAIHLATCILWPKPPSRRRWWITVSIGCTATTLIAYARQTITFPGLHDWAWGKQWWVDHVDPWMVDLFTAVVVIAVLGWALCRWGHRRVLPFAGWVSALAVWIGGTLLLLRPPHADEPVDNRGPNLVLLGVDALRPDHLGFFGYARNTSPTIDAFLADSVVFTQAFTPLARTYPAWIALLSGLLPIHHGIRDNLPAPDHLVPRVPLLPQVLDREGYATAFVTDDSRFSYMVPETGFHDILEPPVGVENFALSVNEPRFRAFHALLHGPIGFALAPVTAYNQAFGKSYRPMLFADHAVDELAKLSHRDRFFYAMHLCVLHAPGDRIYPWNRMFGQRYYTGPNRFGYSRSGTVMAENRGQHEAAALLAQQDENIYDSGVATADAVVGRILSELKWSGLLDRSIIVLFSDHGEELWAPDLPYDYYGPNHGFHAWGNAQYNVLLAIHLPKGDPHRVAPHTVDTPVELIDLAPTLAELLNLSWPTQATDGESLVPLLEGKADPNAPPRTIYMETGLSERHYWVPGHRDYPFHKVSERYAVDEATGRVYLRPEFMPYLVAAKDRILQRGRWKLVWLSLKHGFQLQLFDRLADPLNRHDLAKEHPEVAADLMKRLSPYLEADGFDPATGRLRHPLPESPTPDGYPSPRQAMRKSATGITHTDVNE